MIVLTAVDVALCRLGCAGSERVSVVTSVRSSAGGVQAGMSVSF